MVKYVVPFWVQVALLGFAEFRVGKSTPKTLAEWGGWGELLSSLGWKWGDMGCEWGGMGWNQEWGG